VLLAAPSPMSSSNRFPGICGWSGCVVYNFDMPCHASVPGRPDAEGDRGGESPEEDAAAIPVGTREELVS
jgi:hypothetical protein